MRANPTVTAEWLSSQVPSARLCLGTGPGDRNAGYCENTRVTILGNSAKFGLGCLAGLCSVALVRSMRLEIMRTSLSQQYCRMTQKAGKPADE